MTTKEIDDKIAELQAKRNETELVAAHDTIAELRRQLAVEKERLAKAMEREKALQQENAQLKIDLEKYGPHIDALKRQALEATKAKIDAELAKLPKPE